jgi:biotin carboxylase
MVTEEILHGRQVTANGYARHGRVTMLGTVDSIMYPGTDQFQRFQYPSSLPARDLARVDQVAIRLIEGLGFRHGMFNIEMRIDPNTGAIRVIEINPRAAGQFYDLFERVDGYSPFEAMLDLGSGNEPRICHRAGEAGHAASFVLRDLSGEGLARWPSTGEVRALQARNPDAHVMIYRKRGGDRAREVKWLGSYRYGTLNLGAATLEELFARFHRLCAQIDFHPRGHELPAIERLIAQAAAGDD